MQIATPHVELVRPLNALFRGVTVAFERSNLDVARKVSMRDKSNKIRCPACKWEPAASSRWLCWPMGAPEFFLGGCGTSWNTFDTGGRCPGCAHQWRHTTCLACETTSLHEDWYEEKKEGSGQ